MGNTLPYACMTIDKLMSLGAVMTLREALALGWEEVSVEHDGKTDSCRLNEDGTYSLGALAESDLDGKRIKLAADALIAQNGRPTVKAIVVG